MKVSEVENISDRFDYHCTDKNGSSVCDSLKKVRFCLKWHKVEKYDHKIYFWSKN